MEIKVSEKQLHKIETFDDIYDIMQSILLKMDTIDRDKEHFWIIGFNNANKILFIELISIGSHKTSLVELFNNLNFQEAYILNE